MKINPIRGGSRLARWAVGLAMGTVVMIVVAYSVVAVAYAVGGSGAVADTWVGFLGGIALIGGLLVSLCAFALVVAAKVQRERWALMWFPLSVFPVLLAVTVICELFWFE